MKNIFKKTLIIVLSLAFVFVIAGCKNKDFDPNHFTYLLAKPEDSEYYSKYEQNPAVQYLSSKEWNGEKLSFSFDALIEGSENDQFMTLISTGELYDIMDLQNSVYSVEYLYRNEYAMDLTDLVNQYMPNYKHYLETNQDLKAFGYTNIDGEQKILQIYRIFDSPRPNFQGNLYRRDWIVKYAVNPSTEEPFTSGYTVDGNKDTYYDNVIFPSFYDATKKAWVLEHVDPNWDGSEPIFISDWEWMFKAFKKAIDTENIQGGYCYSIPYQGVSVAGDLFTGFGGGSPLWYTDDNGTVKFGGDSPQMKAYLECMHKWYENGWLDSRFDERATDMFYTINQSATHAGKIGAWQGKTAEIGYEIEADEFPATKGIMMFGAKQPINDVYGEDSAKYHLPDSYVRYTTLAGSVFISTDASEKNLPALLTMMDYCYSEEGSQIVSHGFTKEQLDEFGGSDFYTKWNFNDGVIEIDNRNGNDWIVKTNAAAKDIHAYNAAVGNRLSFGLQHVKYADDGYSDIVNDARTNWDFYNNPGYIIGYRDLMTEEQSSEYSAIYSSITNLIFGKYLPNIITGRESFDTEYEAYKKKLAKQPTDSITEYYQDIMDRINGTK